MQCGASFSSGRLPWRSPWSRWLGLLSRQPEGYWHEFLAGPGAWTLARLTRFPEVVAGLNMVWTGRVWIIRAIETGGWSSLWRLPLFRPTEGPVALQPLLLKQR